MEDARERFRIDGDLDCLALLSPVEDRGDPPSGAKPTGLVLTAPLSFFCL
jgi:hypothetical protein